VTFNAMTHVLSGTPVVGTARTHNITLTASNGVGSNAVQNFTLTVIANLAKFPTTTMLASTPNPSFHGQAVVFTATVSSSGGTPPDGELITFNNGGTTLGTAPLSGGTASLPISSLPVGTSTIKASYAGDASYSASTSAGVQQVVNKYSTSVQLSSSLNPATYGQSVTLTATIGSTGPSTPAGTVTFKNGGTSLGTVTLAAGVATVTRTNLAAGTLSITAVYNGDTVSATSTSSTLSQIVNQATTT
jgi:Big-like domain-containing protein/putative Ig domain-containing protein